MYLMENMSQDKHKNKQYDLYSISKIGERSDVIPRSTFFQCLFFLNTLRKHFTFNSLLLVKYIILCYCSFSNFFNNKKLDRINIPVTE